MQLNKLRALVGKMKSANEQLNMTKRYGNSEMFKYATNNTTTIPPKVKRLEIWGKLAEKDSRYASISLPLNGFEEMILLTEQGRLWNYPIDNEQGLDREKQVPFDNHVFFDHLLEDFPDNEYIKTFMEFVVAGLGKNHWMTVDRKHEIISFYKDYFEEKKQVYKESGLEL